MRLVALLVGVAGCHGQDLLIGNSSDTVLLGGRLLQDDSSPSCEYMFGEGRIPCPSLCSAGRQQSPVDLTSAAGPASIGGDSSFCSGFDSSVAGHGAAHSGEHRRLQPGEGERASTFGMLASYEPAQGVRVSNSMERPYMLDIEPVQSESGAWARPSTFGYVNVNGELYYATRISIRAFPQHTIDGDAGIAELEIEHKLLGEMLSESESRVFFTSVIIEEGQESPMLRTLGVDHRVPALGEGFALDVKLDMSEVLENALRGEYFFYRGSLTAPPCTENIPWVVTKNRITASQAQLALLKSHPQPLYGRDPQPLYGRSVMTTIPPLGVSQSQTCDGRWSYDTPGCWEQCSARGNWQCGGDAQSPINIVLDDVQEKEDGDNYMHFARYHPVLGLQVKNDGHGLSVANDNIGYVTIGQYHYFVKSFHVHFPSEHAINGKIYPGELQIVHQQQYSLEGDIAATVRDETHDNTLVASIFFEQGEESELIEQLLEPHSPANAAATCTTSSGDVSCNVEQPVDLMRSLGPALSGPFFRYDGSLTAPPCAQGVKWFVFETPMTISVGQWNEFKAMFPAPAGTNRPVQPLGDRVVRKNSFEGLGEVPHQQFVYDFVLAPGYGRNREKPDPRLILIFVAGVLILACLVMASVFVFDDRATKRAGGLVGASFSGRMFGRPESANLNQV